MQRLIGLILGIAVVAAVTGVYSTSRNGAAALPAPTAAATTAPRPPVTPSPLPSPTPEKTATPVPILEPKPTAAPQPSVAMPTRIEIPAIGVNTAFEYVGLTSDGAMDTPKNPTQVGWYKLGPKPGERGNAVIDGHVDWGGKLMPFWGLHELKPGDTVIITESNGQRYQFVVQWSKMYNADNAPVNEIFAQSNVPEITLITCGGAFDHAIHTYLGRLIVRATLR